MSIDGIRLDRFDPGGVYEVGTNLGSVLLAEGWAKPATADDAPQEKDSAILPPSLIVERFASSPFGERPAESADRPARARRRAARRK